MRSFIIVGRKQTAFTVLLLFLLIGFSFSCGDDDNSPIVDRIMDRDEDCPMTANYQVTFTSLWTENSHGSTPPFPTGAHFTNMVGATHSSDVTFWESGELASPGIELVAELGISRMLNEEIDAEMEAKYISGRGIGGLPSSNPVTFSFDTNEDFPLLTLVSMIAPSPDWFVGVNSLELRQDDGCWQEMIQRELRGYDAGTETGTTFSLDNPPQSPQEFIGEITALPESFRDMPFATLTIELQ